MAIITPTGISGITSITSTGNTLQFNNATGGNLNVSGLSVSSGTDINVTGVVTATRLNATTITGVSTAGITTAYIGSINDGPISGARNRIINGDMRIDQRYAGANLTYSGTGQMVTSYYMDRWTPQTFGGGGSPYPAGVYLTMSTDTDVPSPSTSGISFRKSLKMTLNQNVSFTGASASTPTAILLKQPIEGNNFADMGFGATGATTFTLSFWVKATKTGTFSVAFQNNASNRSYVTTCTIASVNTWQKFVVTVPGDTTGTWATDNTVGVSVVFSWSGNPNWISTSTLNSWQGNNVIYSSTQTQILTATNDAVWITGVQLEPGTVATPFEVRSYGQELALCQRYYWQMPAAAAAMSGWFKSPNTTSDGWVYFPVTMRTSPVVTSQGTTTFTPYNYATNATVASTTSFTYTLGTTNKILITLSGHGAGTSGNGTSIDLSGSPLNFSSEL